MPEKGKNILNFQNYQNQLKVPYIIYADFESLINKIEGPASDPNKSNTQLIMEPASSLTSSYGATDKLNSPSSTNNLILLDPF